MATFYLRNFGCRASQSDGAALKRQLAGAELDEVDRAEAADIVVLNTCTVTAVADSEVRQVVRRIHRRNPQCRILVTGCYAQRDPQEIAALDGVTWVVGNSHKHKIAEILGLRSQSPEDSGRPSTEAPDSARFRSDGQGFPAFGGLVQIIDSTARSVPGQGPFCSPTAQIFAGQISDTFHFAPVFADDRTRPTLKIQDGCDARCSFCIIPAVRGRSRSLAPDLVIQQVRELVGSGYQEIVLSGINLGGYGRDLNRSIDFVGLLRKMLAETDVPRLRVSSIEPMDVSPALIRLAATQPRLAKHFHIPLQSASDRVLRQMNRRYWSWQYAERLAMIRSAMADCAIGADVMVGFPGETLEDHGATLRFVESQPFTYLHVFPYSARPGTPAAARQDHLNGHILHQRGEEMRALGQQKHAQFVEAQKGRTVSALTLSEQHEGQRLAITSNYLKVVLPGSSVGPNQLLDVEVGRYDGGFVYGYSAAGHEPWRRSDHLDRRP